MFSIVIPLYNKEKQIANTIRTVLDQTYQKYEILIINDGCTDGSINEVQKFSDKRIRIISQRNAGVSAARNIGIENAKYEWVAFLDADDLWEREFLQEMTIAINDYNNVAIFAGGRSTAREGEILRYQNHFLPQDGATDFVNFFGCLGRNDCPIHTSSIIIKKEHFSKNGFFRIGQRNYEDLDLWIRLCANEKIVFVNKPLAIYVIQEGHSASKLTYNAEDCVRMLDTFCEVQNKLKSYQDKIDLKIFYQKHCSMVILRFFSLYSKNQKEILLSRMSNVLEKDEFFKLKIIQFLKLQRIILFAKKLKSGILKMRNSS